MCVCVCACVCVCVCVWRVPFDESISSRPFLKFTREWIKAHVAQIEVCSKGQPQSIQICASYNRFMGLGTN